MARNSGSAEVVQGDAKPGDQVHEKMRDLVGAFEREVKGILGSAVIDSEGVALAWTLKGGAHQIAVSTLGSALRQVTERTGNSLDLGDPVRGLVACDKGSLAVYDIPRTGLALVVLLDSNANYVDFMVSVRLLVNQLSGVIVGG